MGPFREPAWRVPRGRTGPPGSAPASCTAMHMGNTAGGAAAATRPGGGPGAPWLLGGGAASYSVTSATRSGQLTRFSSSERESRGGGGGRGVASQNRFHAWSAEAWPGASASGRRMQDYAAAARAGAILATHVPGRRTMRASGGTRSMAVPGAQAAFLLYLAGQGSLCPAESGCPD